MSGLFGVLRHLFRLVSLMLLPKAALGQHVLALGDAEPREVARATLPEEPRRRL